MHANSYRIASKLLSLFLFATPILSVSPPALRTVAFGGQIIGPALFPFYLRVLKFNLGLTSAVLLVIFAALFAAGQPTARFLQIFLDQFLIQFAAVTLIFWLIDKHLANSPDSWD